MARPKKSFSPTKRVDSVSLNVRTIRAGGYFYFVKDSKNIHILGYALIFKEQLCHVIKIYHWERHLKSVTFFSGHVQ